MVASGLKGPNFFYLIMNMDEQNQIQTGSEPKKKSYFKIILVLALVVVLVGGYLAWVGYFSPGARRERELQKNYEQAQKALSEFETAMRNDTYGGKTPQETLNLFIDALKKNDFELASKYFSIDGKTTQDEWKLGLEKANQEGRLGSILTELGKTKLTKTSSELNTAWFVVLDSSGQVGHEILLELNKYSDTWKIESL